MLRSARWVAIWALPALIAGAGCDEDNLSAVDPILEVNPTHLDFGTVELGQQGILPVTMLSLEKVSAEISSIEIVDDCDGCFRVLNPTDRVEGLHKYELLVRFRSVRIPIATGTVTITITDEGEAPKTVTMVGRGSDKRRPDIEVVPAVVDFGFVPAGGVAVSSFAIRSTGTNPLLLDRIRIDPPDAPFRITTSTPTQDNPRAVEPGAQRSVALKAALPEGTTGTVTASVIIESNVTEVKNVPGHPGWVELPLTSLANLPPIAVAGADQNVEPWSRVTLDGSDSYDQDVPPDEPLSYSWRLIGTPPGSTTTLERHTKAQPSFWVDLAGQYELELTVTDTLGLPSQDPDILIVEALPTNALRIELIWDHPDSDLDLHLIRDGGSFCDCASDCHYRDCGRAPNWFPMTPGANPHLDVDDRSGFGPETIDVDGEGATRFIPDGRYRIAVHYYSSNGQISPWPTTTSNATVRVHIFGLLAAELTNPMINDGELWTAGYIRWPQREVVPATDVVPGQECGVF